MKLKYFKKIKEFIRALKGDIPKITIESTKHGIFCGLKNDYLFKQAIENGVHEPHFLNLVDNLLSPTDVALDVGGNIGTHAILLSKKLKEGHVYTFESQSLVFSILQNNLLLNNCNNVTAYRFAVSNENHSTISMEPFTFNKKSINNAALKVDLEGAMGDFSLTRTLDSFEFKKVDFIKIDIQGSEVKALKGAKNLILNQKPIIFIEIEEQYLRDLGTSSKELIETIFSLNYVMYRIETEYPCDYVCVPKEKVDSFEKNTLKKLSFKTSKKISGKSVNVFFANTTDQIYKKLEILE
ncbi:FkbM family methyltransferase [Candidatus Pelagibacter sp.]|nr:FkbM family methyltransferase [Candidatus Pelagibacter sp.]